MNLTELDNQLLTRLGDRIRLVREDRNVSLEALARVLRTGCTPQDVAKIEVGFTPISIIDLNRISLALDTPLYRFIDDGVLFHKEDQRFMEAYGTLNEFSRSKVRDIVFALAGDDPMLHP